MSTQEELLVGSLMCNCKSVQIYTDINECIALQRFADATGSTLYTTEGNRILLSKLRPYFDYLRGGRYELGFSCAGKKFIEKTCELSLCEPLSYHKHRTEFGGAMGERYFVCKSCCPLCRSMSRGCPLHCCTLCWKHLSKLDKISKSLELIPIKKVTKLRINNFIATVGKDTSIKNGKLLKPNTGYLHNDLDIAIFLLRNWEFSDEEGLSIIKQLANM